MAAFTFKGSGFGGSKASRDANYVTPGHYVMRIDSVRMKANRKSEPIFVVEMTPIHVLAEDPLTETEGLMNGIPTVSNKRGVPCTHLIPLTGPGQEMAMPNMMAFAESLVPGLADESPAEKEAVMDTIVSDEQPLAGLLVEVVARCIVTRKKTHFTKITYIGIVSDEERLKRGLITQEQYDAIPKS